MQGQGEGSLFDVVHQSMKAESRVVFCAQHFTGDNEKALLTAKATIYFPCYTSSSRNSTIDVHSDGGEDVVRLCIARDTTDPHNLKGALCLARGNGHDQA